MKNDRSLERVRRRIDTLDDHLLKLLGERGRLAKEIGRIKAKKGETVLAASRESEILGRLASNNKGPLSPEAVNDIFQTIFSSCRAIQKRVTVAYFGPEATFTHQAAIKHFGRDCEFVGMPSIADVFYEVERKRADYGVVPVENSTEGVVNHTLDMFMESDLKIIAERGELISQNLLSVSGRLKDVKTVYSHAQALAQCRKWLDTHLPGVALHSSASTSDAAVHATLDGSSAAIASRLAGQMYNLKPIALGLEDSVNNATRFLIIGHTSPEATGRDRTSIMLSIKDRVGALYDILQPFRAAGVNLTKIESRPTKKKAWQYVFFVDFIGHQSDPKVKNALKGLAKDTVSLKILGSYPYTA
jgi:chorismate mutase/prephenate dehydratase